MGLYPHDLCGSLCSIFSFASVRNVLTLFSCVHLAAPLVALILATISRHWGQLSGSQYFVPVQGLWSKYLVWPKARLAYSALNWQCSHCCASAFSLSLGKASAEVMTRKLNETGSLLCGQRFRLYYALLLKSGSLTWPPWWATT